MKKLFPLISFLTIYFALLGGMAHAQQFFPGGLTRPTVWYSGTSFTAPSSAGNTSETVLTDLSGNGVNATEDGVNVAPGLVTDYFGTGLHGIQFVAVTPTLANSDRLAIANNQALNSDANGYRYKMLSFFIELPAITSTLPSAPYAATGESEYVLYEQGNGDYGLVLYLTDNGTNFFVTAGFNTYVACACIDVTSGPLAPNTQHIITYYYDYIEDKIHLYVDGTDYTSPTLPTPPYPGVSCASYTTPADSLPVHTGNIKLGANGSTYLLGNVRNGTNRFFQGILGEMVFYNAADQSRRVILENAIAAKYGFTTLADDQYDEALYPGYTNDLIGIGFEASSDKISANEYTSSGLTTTDATFLADAGDYLFAGHNGAADGFGTDAAPPAPFTGPVNISNREWAVSVADANTNGGTVKISFDLDEIGMPITQASKYFLVVNLGYASSTLGTATMQVISSSSRRISFTVDIDDIDGLGTDLNGAYLSIGVDNPITTLETTFGTAVCTNGTDDDFDGLIDNFDPGCAATGETVALTGNASACKNDIDEDQDGLVDCFDPDCAGGVDCDGKYFGPATPSCQYVPKQINDFSVDTLFKTATQIEQRCGVFVGDMDGDGVPEAVGKNSGRITIFSGKTGATIQRITTPTTGEGSTFALANIDPSSNPTTGKLAEIFVVGTDSFLYCFNYNTANGTGGATVATATARRWTSSGKCLGRGSSPQLADFNQDGVAEVYVGNDIFNAQTGIRLVNGSASQSAGLISNSYDGEAWPIAYDVFTESAGLELVAGNRIYKVVLGNGTTDNGYLVELSYAPNGLGDGFTSVADMNLDGQVDVITSSSGKVYVWSPSYNAVGTQLGTTYSTPPGSPSGTTARGARCNVGNFDNDREPEIGIAGKHVYTVIDYNSGANTLTTMVSSGSDPWPATAATTGGAGNDASGNTGIVDDSEISGSTLFDFEGDGTYEIIYSDERSLYVWRAASARVLLKLRKGAGTRTEYPLVVDVDGDEIPEVVFTGQPGGSPSKGDGTYGTGGYVKAVKMRNFAPVKTRITWNQHGFFNTNVNDDLTIPRLQQNASEMDLCDISGNQCRLNGFLTQTTILDEDGAPIFPSPDPSIDASNFDVATDVDVSDCPTGDGDSKVTIHIPVINNGSTKVASGMPVTVFLNDPFSALPAPSVLATAFTSATLDVNGTTTVSVTFDNPVPASNLNFTLLVNDIGVSTTGFPYGQGATEDARRSDSLHSGSGDCRALNNIYRGSIGSCILLAAALIDFVAENNTSTVDLEWIVGGEDRANLYVLERAGENLLFEAIGSYAKTGAGQEYNAYKHTDFSPLNGRSFYRVKIIGVDGSMGFSETIEVRRGDISGSFIRVYPNPATANQRLIVDGLDGLNVADIHMFNIMGEEVRTLDIHGGAFGEIPLVGLEPGLYTLRINGEQQSYWRKVVIE